MAKNTVIETGKSFVNPYNFVPFASWQPERKEYDSWTGGLTGKIDCEIMIQTPVAILDTEHRVPDEKVSEHYHYPFMRRVKDDDSTAFIPGSEIRGMIRSVYEAATDSCMGILEDTPLNGRGTSFVKGFGLIKKEGQSWYLYEIDNHNIAFLSTFGDHPLCRSEKDNKGVYVTSDGIKYRQGQNVRFEANLEDIVLPNGQKKGKRLIVTKLGQGNMNGYLLIAEQGLNDRGAKRHKYSHIMIKPAAAARGIPINDEIKNLQTVIELYRDNTLNRLRAEDEKKHTGYAGYTISENDFTPVFYRKVGERYLLSPAMQGREVYGSNLQDFVGGYGPCLTTAEQDLKVCAACALFGKIGKDVSYGSRLRFTDANADGAISFQKEVQLKELSSPKVSSTEFYTELNKATIKQRPKEWNYLYYVTDAKNPELFTNNQLHLRGRKFYLHQSIPDFQAKTGELPTERSSTVEIATKGKFKFTVYFEKLTEKELDMLLWCLSPWRSIENKQESLYHKIGHGRPLGLGSIRIVLIGKPEIRQIEKKSNGDLAYSTVEYSDHSQDAEKTVPEALKNILAFSIKNVSYPIGKNIGSTSGANADAGHQWFSLNRTADGTGNDHNLRYVLPYLPTNPLPTEKIEKALQLPAMESSSSDLPSPKSGLVDDAYQIPQTEPWKGAKATAAVRKNVETVINTQVKVGGRYMAIITKIIPEKGFVYCKMPDGRDGFLRVFNNIGKYKVDQDISVYVNRDDKENNNWNLKPGS